MLALALWLLLNPANLGPVDSWTDSEICADGVSCEDYTCTDDDPACDAWIAAHPDPEDCTEGNVNAPECDDAFGRTTDQAL